jgi:hypothetical protein
MRMVARRPRHPRFDDHARRSGDADASPLVVEPVTARPRDGGARFLAGGLRSIRSRRRYLPRLESVERRSSQAARSGSVLSSIASWLPPLVARVRHRGIPCTPGQGIS